MLTPRKLTLMNTTTRSLIQDLSFPSSILAVRMNKKRYVILSFSSFFLWVGVCACMRACVLASVWAHVRVNVCPQNRRRPGQKVRVI